MFNNKVIIVTGATSGMGMAVARMLHHRGAHLSLTGRNTEQGQRLLDELSGSDEKLSRCFVSGDVSKSSFCEQLVQETMETFGRIDGLVNTAGMIHRGSALETSDEQWQACMSTNIDGTFFMSRATVRTMLEKSPANEISQSDTGGSIVNFGSTCALVGSEGLAAYCASKGAVVQLTRAMALDHATDNIRINAVCPGAVDTPMLMSGREQAPMGRDAVHAMNLETIPQNRIPDPEEVAELVCFLLGDGSKHITGTAIPIDGGYTAQ